MFGIQSMKRVSVAIMVLSLAACVCCPPSRVERVEVEASRDREPPGKHFDQAGAHFRESWHEIKEGTQAKWDETKDKAREERQRRERKHRREDQKAREKIKQQNEHT